MIFGPRFPVARLRTWWHAPWSRNPRLGLALIVAASLVAISISFAGPSVVALTLGPRDSWLPPWYLPGLGARLNEWAVVVPLWLAIPAGAIGLRICWLAVVDGWRPGAWRLFGLGTGLSVASTLVPPLTSADVLMYAAYGRIQTLGIDPWTVPPADIYRRAFDPVIYWTERPWQDTPSVYGPIPSFSQWLAATLGGANMHDTVFWLQVISTIPFLLIGLMLMHLTKGDSRAQHRAVLFTVLNPLLLWSVVVGAHNEALCLVFAVAALLFLRRNPWLAGLFIGLAGCTKVSLVFYGLAMVWAYRFAWRNVGKLALGALAPLVVSYGILAPKALLAAGRNVGYISAGTWSPWPYELLNFVGLNPMITRQLLSALGWLGLVLLAWMLSTTLPWHPAPGLPDAADARQDPLTIALRTAIVISAAWFISSPYTMPWYDLLAWVPLAVLGATKLDGLLAWRGAWLSMAYVTGRAVEFSPAMLATAFVIRDVLSTGAQYAVFGAVVLWWIQAGKPLPSIRYVMDGWQRVVDAWRGQLVRS